MTTAVFSSTYTVTYKTKNPLPIADVIVALQSLEGLLKNVPKIISGITGVEIDGHEFIIERIESGSLTEQVLVKLFFKDEADLDAFLAKIRGNNMLKVGIVGVALGGLITYGLIKATGDAKPTPNITANNNTIINIGAGEVKLTPEAFEAIVRTAVGDKKEVAKNALRFVSPAKSDPDASIVLQGVEEGATEIRISPEAIAETPKKLDIKANERIIEMERVTLKIRAADLDSKSSGWAGRIDGVTDRVKIQLDPEVSEMALFGKSSVIADVGVIKKPSKKKSKELVPTGIVVRHIYTP